MRKIIKKIAKIATGALLIGSTIAAGVMAGNAGITGNLGDYPSPMFIQNGQFNGAIVVGDNAAASDIVGAIDIAMSLQYQSSIVKEISIGGMTIDPTISEGVRIDKSGNDLNFGETIVNVQSSALDDSDLPNVLMIGDFEDTEGKNDNSETYSQELQFEPNNARLIFDQDDDDAPNAGDYLKINDNTLLYTYILEFSDTIEYDVDEVENDLETTHLEIQGKIYTIVDVDVNVEGYIDEITLQAGETTSWLEEGVEISKAVAGVTHTIILENVNEAADKCGLNVDGTTAWIDLGQTRTINGVSIGVTDAIVVHSAGKDTDVCEVNLGAEEIVLSDGNEVEINGADIEGSEVTINIDSATTSEVGYWEGFTITYESEEDIWLAPGDSFVDPVFGNFMIKYSGLTKLTEQIEVDVSGDEAELTFVSIDGEDIEIPIFCTGDCDEVNDTIILGTGIEIDEKYYVVGETCTSLDLDVTDCEGMNIIINANGETHIVEVDDIDTGDGKITIKDTTYGTSKTSDYIDSDPLDPEVSIIDLPSGAGVIELTIDEDSGTIEINNPIELNSNAYVAGDKLKTELGADISINVDVGTGELTDPMITIYETGGEDGDASAATIIIDFSVDEGDEEIDIDLTLPLGTYSVDKSDSDDDTKMITTLYGTLIEYDQEDRRNVEISYSEEEVYGNVFVAPTSAIITGSGGTEDTTTVSTTVITQINIGTAKLASEIADIKQIDAIIVGGPCANAAAATLMGNPEKCWEAIPENKAIIKLYEHNGKVSLLVAGRTALDTRRAARVISRPDLYDLAGHTEIEVTGTSLTDISVSAPIETEN